MVTVELKRGKDTAPTVLTATGHAGYGAAGCDTVCAALSVLVYTAAYLVEEWEKKGCLQQPPTLELEAGRAFLAFLPTETFAQTARIAMETVAKGITLLKNYYPKYVTVKIQ